MKKSVLLVWMVCFILGHSNDIRAQDEIVHYSGNSIGVGMGLDYGGFGGRFSVLPSPQFGLFLGMGYNTMELGYNAGAIFRISPHKRTCPYIVGMYGYNGVVIVKNMSSVDKTFYGPSLGFGFEFHSRYKPLNFFNFEVLVPFRSDFTNYIDDLKEEGIEFENEPLPIQFSLGYHFGF